MTKKPWLAVLPAPLLSTSCLEPISAHEVDYLLGRPSTERTDKSPSLLRHWRAFSFQRCLMLLSGAARRGKSKSFGS